MVGVPVTSTISSNTTCTLMAPDVYVPLAVDDVTLVTVGAVVSMMIALLAPRLPAAAGATSVKVAGVAPAVALIVPAFNSSDVVAV